MSIAQIACERQHNYQKSIYRLLLPQQENEQVSPLENI